MNRESNKKIKRESNKELVTQSGNGLKIYRADSIDEIPLPKALEYPFDRKLLQLLKEQNHFKQEYYYLEKGNSFAFFVVYHNRMDIFSFGKLSFYYPVKVIGFPCSLSSVGYVTNDEKLLLDYLKNIKGAKLVLNVATPIERKDYVMGETLPTCILDLAQAPKGQAYQTIDHYMDSLRSSYRRRMNQAINACLDVEIRGNVRDKRVHELYLNTYNKSGYKLERLEQGFFEEVDADNLVFYRADKPIGFVLLKGVGEQLIFMFCGMDYATDTTDLYYFMIYNIIKYAIENGYKRIDLGQTSEETKMKFGAALEKKYFYAHHTNPFINFMIKAGKGLLEYHYDFPKFRVFKENR